MGRRGPGFVKIQRISGVTAAGLCLLGAYPALASSVALDSAVYVERTAQGDARRLEPASTLARGDRVVTVLNWSRSSGSGGFTVVNPLPRAIAYQRSGEDMEELSVDGGRSWGQLGALRVGVRMATPEDVTHVRWRVPAARAAMGRGRIAYSAIVR